MDTPDPSGIDELPVVDSPARARARALRARIAADVSAHNVVRMLVTALSILAVVTLMVVWTPNDNAPAVQASIPDSIWSEENFALIVQVPAFADQPLDAGELEIQVLLGDGTWKTVMARQANGRFTRLPAVAWKPQVLRVRALLDGAEVGVSNSVKVTPTPAGTVVPTNGLRQPKVEHPVGHEPVGEGANAVVEPIPDAVWKAMKGVSWQKGCPVGRDDLRLVSVNHWGFDGYRYRGRIIVNASVADEVAAAFTDLYDDGYPIRQMRLPESFGKGPYRGATDYEMMAADNTSGFNCRYVVGKEKQRELSPHAYGTAIDMNPFENPYLARTGVFPSKAWVPRDIVNPAVLRSRSTPAVQAFTSRGATWGGTFDAFDYHHFEW